MKTPTFHRAFLLLTIAYAYVLAIVQFAFARSFWCDEAAIALNVLKRDYLELMQPLDDLQGAPILYLWTLKTMTLLFGTGEQSLRLPSLLAYLLSVPLMLALLRRTMKNELAVMAGLAFFVLNSRLLFYAGELKPYMGDIVWTLILTLTVVYDRWSLHRRIIALAVIGKLAIFSSNAMFAVLPMIFLLVLFRERDHWGHSFFRQMFMMGITWTAAVGIFLIVFVKDHPSTGPLRAMFRKTKQIPPSNLFSSESIEFWAKSCKNLKRDFLLGVNNVYQTDQIPSKLQKTEIQFHALYPVTFKIIHTIDLLIFAILGLMFLWGVSKQQRSRLLWLLPLFIHGTLTYLGLFPLANRLLMYAYPLIILVLATGVDRILISFPGFNRPVMAGLIGYALFTSVALARSYIPHEVMEMRSVVVEVQKRLKGRQDVYVVPQAWTMFEYYHLRGTIQPMGAIVKGSRPPGIGGFEPFCEQIRAMPAEKWVIIGNIWDTQAIEMADRLKSEGELFLDSTISKGVRAYLLAAKPSQP